MPNIELFQPLLELSAAINTSTEELQTKPEKKRKSELKEMIQKLNDRLASKYNSKGYFPLVVVLDAKGKVKGQLGYEKLTPEAYIALIEQL